MGEKAPFVLASVNMGSHTQSAEILAAVGAMGLFSLPS
jgi:hypothetical protein